MNALWAILATGAIIFLAAWPLSVYAARHGVDMDLLTRGAGFGYIGSTITSLIYASFTFAFFALEAAIMACAIELAFDPAGLGLPAVLAGRGSARHARRHLERVYVKLGVETRTAAAAIAMAWLRQLNVS